MENYKDVVTNSIKLGDKSLEELTAIFPNIGLIQVLNELTELGYIWKNKKGKYTLIENDNLVYGVLRCNEKGFAFLEKINVEGDDVFIAETDLKGALHGDKVLVRLKNSEKKQSSEGKVIEILGRTLEELVGTFFENGSMSFVKPDDKRLHLNVSISKELQNGAINGHKVLVKLMNYDTQTKSADASIIKILGHKNDPGVDILSIVYNHGINVDFSEDALDQANSIADSIDKKDMLGRRDLRNEIIVTIDGEDAKDLDDAVSAIKLENGHYKLGVHIADVSHYVQEESPLDVEAYERGTSVYLVDRVIPMLPHRLSNGICSLNPQVDRLTLSCEMVFDEVGNLMEYELFESIIKTTERMTYTDVRKILLKEDEEVYKKYKPLVPTFELMSELSHILRNKRHGKGSIDFDVKEGKVVLDENGKTKEIVFRERSIAEKLIEDFMLAANETVANHFHKEKIPFIYRIHGTPHEKRLNHFVDFISSLGYRLNREGSTVNSIQLQSLLEKTSETEEGSIISRLALRSMQQAKYTPENIGHYGLAFENYTHFTSPIRRYPDLMVHRLIKENINQNSDSIQDGRIEKLLEASEHASQRERRAVLAERDTMEMKKAEYMEDKVGSDFSGIISSVTKFGFFVELENTIEGLVHVKTLNDDHYVFDEKSLSLYGKKTRKKYTIGEKVKVKLINVDVDEHSIDFDILKKRNFSTKSNKNTKSKKRTHDRDSSRKKSFDSLYE